MYRIDIETHKDLEPLRGALHRALTPFLEPLLLRGVDPAYLVTMRDRAIASSEPVFRDVAGRMLAKGYPSTVWQTHTGTGAHISRTRIHTELGQLGPEGVSAALALTAQRDARSQRFYQGKAVAAAQRRAGQNMIDDLLGECFEE